MTHPDLVGKAAIVTGAGAGIGLAIARRLAIEGCRVLCADINGESAGAAAAEIGAGAVAHQVDVSDEQQVIAMVEACVEAFGGVDKLVANAGVVHFAPLLDTTVDDFDRVMRVNLRGAFLCTKHAAPRMVQRGGGAIVNMSSLGGLIAAAGTAAYGMSKAGIIHLSRITAAELRSVNVRSNALLPAFVDTPMQQTAMTMFDEALGAGGADTMIGRLQGRMAGPEEMAGVVAFLLSDDASMVNGTAQVADGGTVAALW
ncbi:SDR family oxidoreductase [Mycobacterium sp. CVI_P3]|uniref:SDR family oxidoreductase n=1 Tax=Mycobacterium pinniadriaticum TaxID=2994102 RepID=A0ABT3SHM0_9MYCO|nr:SDR family oxidoreductase [Mycobacterium pinniadriaticum]MCX2932536.1 SDR family oxidoreductase [Mycobacterium pinniadriaticum]MCX2939020.1 SDR family oxidoreductase [Mycobacterium pinniadriaticum]